MTKPSTHVLPPSSMTRQEFVACFGSVFEQSLWISEVAYNRGLGRSEDNPKGLHRALCAVLRAAPHDRKLALINAHPDLAGRLAVADELTEASTVEQASAGLDRCTAEEFESFRVLNARYKRRFGIPFIMAVKGSNRDEILAALETRLENHADAEFQTALEQIERIAFLRLRGLFDPPDQE